jgi:UDP-glucuronate 4-epimerase
VPITFADISKAQRLLNYAPRTSFRQGIEAFVSWYRGRAAGSGT